MTWDVKTFLKYTTPVSGLGPRAGCPSCQSRTNYPYSNCIRVAWGFTHHQLREWEF
ncbi:hypothetical protein B0J17DRAFT_677609 [Rhizoctonia solani]|nr:hypothetical protein B0J17DRAFT_677609 [Rhizoctonia solani]